MLLTGKDKVEASILNLTRAIAISKRCVMKGLLQSSRCSSLAHQKALFSFYTPLTAVIEQEPYSTYWEPLWIGAAPCIQGE